LSTHDGDLLSLPVAEAHGLDFQTLDAVLA